MKLDKEIKVTVSLNKLLEQLDNKYLRAKLNPGADITGIDNPEYYWSALHYVLYVNNPRIEIDHLLMQQIDDEYRDKGLEFRGRKTS